MVHIRSLDACFISIISVDSDFSSFVSLSIDSSSSFEVDFKLSKNDSASCSSRMLLSSSIRGAVLLMYFVSRQSGINNNYA